MMTDFDTTEIHAKLDRIERKIDQTYRNIMRKLDDHGCCYRRRGDR